MGLSLFSAMIGLAILALGGVLLALRKQRIIVIACILVGLLLIFVPYLYISSLD